MNEIKEEIGKRVRLAREHISLSQKGLGATIDVTNQVIHSYEIGRALPPIPVAIRLAKELKVSLNWLLTGEDQGPIPKPPTPEEKLRLLLTSDTSLVAKIKEDLRQQVREEMQPYTLNGDSKEQQLLKAFRLLDDGRKERLIGMAEDMSEALSRGSDRGQEGGDCAGSKSA